MKTKTLKIILAGMLLFLASCSSPLDRPYNEKTLMEDLQIIIARNNVNKTDMMNLAEYLSMQHKDSIEGKTYRQLIQAANEFAREREK